LEKVIFKEKLKDGLESLALDYNENILEKLYIYMKFLLEENKKYNLTSITKEEEVITKHFIDSLSLIPFLKDEKNLIDVGTGAGFPGMVLKIYRPDLDIVLLDSLLKRINFLLKLKNRLELNNIELIHSRAELVGKKEFRGRFNMAVSRAVAPLNVLFEYTIPLVKPGALMALYKGPEYETELKQAKRALNLLGGELFRIISVNNKLIPGERYIIIAKKVLPTPSKYPRRNGIPKKRPL